LRFAVFLGGGFLAALVAGLVAGAGASLTLAFVPRLLGTSPGAVQSAIRVFAALSIALSTCDRGVITKCNWEVTGAYIRAFGFLDRGLFRHRITVD
jgi:hypothetical protein